jgi:hypothetical protein
MTSDLNYNKFTNILDNKDSFKKLLENLEAFPGNITGTISSNGKKNITNYFELKNILNEFKKIKDCLLTVIELSKTNFQNIKISRKNYNLYKEKLFFENFTGNSDNDLAQIINKNSLNIFIKKFSDNDFLLYKDSDTLDFLNVFQNEYFEKSKNYFINIMNKYIAIRKKLKKNINNYDYRMFYKDLYEYHEDYKLEIKKNKNNSENYVLYGNNISFNNENKKPDILSEKDKILEKRDTYEKLYKNKKSIDSYINDFQKRYKDYHGDFYKGLNNILSGPINIDLYSYLINSINTDYNLINFIFYYENNLKFKNTVVNYLNIQKDILILVNNFEKYYDPYLSWYKSILTPSTPIEYKKNSIESFGDFDEYYDEEIKSLFR